MFGWILSIFTIIGAILNAKRNKYGFIVWIGANLCWIGFNFYTNTISQIPIWVVMTIISVYGFINWSNKAVVISDEPSQGIDFESIDFCKKCGRARPLKDGYCSPCSSVKFDSTGSNEPRQEDELDG